MEGLGKLLVFLGLGIALFGAIVWAGERSRVFRFGRLPGDIVYERNGVGFYIPIVSMLVASVILSLVLWVVGKIRS